PCVRCGRSIVWAKAPAGSLLAVQQVYGYTLLARPSALPLAERGPPVWVSHFLRCAATDRGRARPAARALRRPAQGGRAPRRRHRGGAAPRVRRARGAAGPWGGLPRPPGGECLRRARPWAASLQARRLRGCTIVVRRLRSSSWGIAPRGGRGRPA